MKNISKIKITKRTAGLVAIFVLLFGVVVYQFLAISVLADRINQVEKENTWNTNLIYACYNNKIYPCDDDGVSKWNEQNPDKAITPESLRESNS